jgi:Domain of unknown function (DUF4258)
MSKTRNVKELMNPDVMTVADEMTTDELARYLIGSGIIGFWPCMDHYFPDVPGLGNVAVSRHAQARMVEDGISEHDFKEALLNGSTTPDGQDVLWREKDGVRVVILRQPTPFKGAMLAKTVHIACDQSLALPSDPSLFRLRTQVDPALADPLSGHN